MAHNCIRKRFWSEYGPLVNKKSDYKFNKFLNSFAASFKEFNSFDVISSWVDIKFDREQANPLRLETFEWIFILMGLETIFEICF
jgi:hypothetical protein